LRRHGTVERVADCCEIERISPGGLSTNLAKLATAERRSRFLESTTPSSDKRSSTS
jgi:hypothetical protein